MASKRKQDEKHLNILRGMVKLEFNKQCFDCTQKGPTYVDMTIGAFVCTSCSGLLRGLNPQHRVKSISMASFTPEEIDFVKCRGNHFCQKVWLGLHNRSHLDILDSKDENKIRDFMIQKYEKKRFYVAPTEHMHEEARKLNTPAKTEPTTRPLRPIGNVLKPAHNSIIVNQTKPEVPSQSSIHIPRQPVNHPVTQPPTQSAAQPRVDLLSDLGGDPFQPSQKPAAAPEQGGFADFGAFGGMPTSQPTFPSQPQPQPPAFQPQGTGLLSPMNAAQPAHSAPSSQAQQPGFGAPAGGGDKYSALASLDTEFNTAPTTSAPATVQWNSTGSSSGGGGGGFGVHWGGGASAISQSALSESPATSSSSGYNAVSNPFGGAPQSSQPNPFANPASLSQSPAGGGSFNQSTFPAQFSQSAPGFSQPAFGQSAPGYSGTQAGFIQSPSGAGGMFAAGGGGQMSTAMTNGGHQPAGWGGQLASQGQMTQFGAAGFGGAGGMGGGGFPAAPAQKAVPPQGFGMAAGPTQNFASWGAPSQPPAANPFMNIASQAPPATNSTNPFL